jgi:hypothetical protein
LTAGIDARLADPKAFQPLTDFDRERYGTPELVWLAAPVTEDPSCEEKRRHWIEWRAAPYPAARHSEYLAHPAIDNEAAAPPRILLSAILRPPRDLDSYFQSAPKDRRYTLRGTKATNRGYIARPFRPAEHAAAIWDIVHSSTERQGRPIAEMFRERPKDWPFPSYADFTHPEYRDICVGVFLGDTLVAYLLGKRVGSHVQYDEILGHAEHVANDIMYLLHHAFLAACLAEDVVPACLNYGPWYSGRQPYDPHGGLNAWKRRIGFRPGYLILAS